MEFLLIIWYKVLSQNLQYFLKVPSDFNRILFLLEKNSLSKAKKLEQKFDIKKELIKCRLRSEALSYRRRINYSIEKWWEKSEEKGKIEWIKVCTYEIRLLKAIDSLTESKTNKIIEVLNIHSPNQIETIRSIINGKNRELKQIAGILYDGLFPIKGLYNVFKRCYRRYYVHRRYKLGWQKRRLEILQQRGNKCELCGSTTKLQVHHKKGWDDEEDEGLEVLCQECHMTDRHIWDGKRLGIVFDATKNSHK